MGSIEQTQYIHFTIVIIERRSHFVHGFISNYIVFCLFVCPAAGAKLVVIKSLDQAHRNTLLEDSENPLPSDPDRDLFHKEIQCWRNRCISGR